SRQSYYADLYDIQPEDGGGRLTQTRREDALKKLMLVNLLKRMESSVDAFRKTLHNLAANIREKLDLIERFEAGDQREDLALNPYPDAFEEEEEESPFQVGKAIHINLADMDLLSWKDDLQYDLNLIHKLYAQLSRVTPEHDTKLQHLHGVLR